MERPSMEFLKLFPKPAKNIVDNINRPSSN